MADQGGYDCDFVEEVHNRYICIICQNPLCDPHLPACCGQHCCQSCLNQWFQSSYTESCPHCRAEGREFQHFLDKKLRQEILALKVTCLYHETYCDWTGELGNLDNHTKQCLVQLVECPNKCKTRSGEVTTVKRKDLDQHLKRVQPPSLYM